MRKSWSSRRVIEKLKNDGWFHFRTTGDHHHYKHPVKIGKVTVPHPRKDLSVDEIKSISQQSKIDFLHNNLTEVRK